MSIKTEFSFKHAPTASNAQLLEIADPVGPLRKLVGAARGCGKARRRWRGSGFNMLWRPNFRKTSGDKEFFLELNLTEETLDFSDITGSGIANRGFLQPDVFLGGIAYTQAVNDIFDGSGQHFELGVWLAVPETSNPREPATVARMGVIPHGTTVNMQGMARYEVSPKFEKSSITPFIASRPDDGKSGLMHFSEEVLSEPSTSRTPRERVEKLTQSNLSDPNSLLAIAATGLNIVETVVITISSDLSQAGSIPDAGGGNANIAFLTGVGVPTAGGPNAAALTATATFWIETVRNMDGSEYLQLQYTQRVLLSFNGLRWPHVSVATLKPVPFD